MSDATITAATIIRFSQEMEARLATYYQALAERFPEHRTAFTDFARDCEKTGVQVMRTYQETVTDALETGYSFAGLSLEAYHIDVTLLPDADLQAVTERALSVEAQAVAFYEDVAARSAFLLATIPRAFKRAARTHRQRRDALTEW